MKIEYFEERGYDLILNHFGVPSIEEAQKVFDEQAVPFYRNSLDHRDYLSGFRKQNICEGLYDKGES